MQQYAIIDTKSFNCACLLLEHQDEHLVVLENRQYLPPVTSASWQDKLPQILKHIAQDLPNTEFVFLLPNAAVIHLTIEVPSRPKIRISDNIAHVLYKNFKISPQKYCFQFMPLGENRYVVSLITKKFYKFIKGAIKNNFKQIKIFPFFTGQFAYTKEQASEQNIVTIFIEKDLRRFFIRTPQETNFIDFYQPNTDASDEFNDIRNVQQFIFQTLDIPENKKLILIGDVSDTLKELYATEYGTPPELPKTSEKLLGCTEKISEIAKCTYLGIDSIINGNASSLNAFDFHRPVTCSCNKFLERWQRSFSVIASICFILSGVFFANEFQQQMHLKEKEIQLHRHRNAIEQLQIINHYLTEKEQQSALLPQILLNYCYLLQTLPGDFCIDHLGFEHSDEQDFCSINGRIYRENIEIFKRVLREKLHRKVDFYTEPSDETIDNFSIRIPLGPLPILS